jgi:hypothetical protein
MARDEVRCVIVDRFPDFERLLRERSQQAAMISAEQFVETLADAIAMWGLGKSHSRQAQAELQGAQEARMQDEVAS